MRRLLFFIVLMLFGAEVFGQATAQGWNPAIHNYSIHPGTYSFRDDANGSVTSNGSVNITSGSSGSIDGITIGGVQIMSGSVPYNSDRTTTASDVAANINAHTSTPNYTATSSGSIITIKDVLGDGAASGLEVLSTSTSLSTTDTNMKGYHDRTSWDSSPYTEGHLKYLGSTIYMNFRLVYPVGYDPNFADGYPLIVMMHGAGERGNCWTNNNCYFEDTSWTPWVNNPMAGPGVSSDNLLNNDHNLVHGGKPHLDAVNRAGSKLPGDPTLGPRDFPGFVLFPQNLNGWVGEEVRHVARILYKLMDEENIDPNKLYIHGLSNGAQFVPTALRNDPGLFAGALLMSPTSANSKFNPTDPISHTIAHIPVWAFQGGKDTKPTPGQTETLIRWHQENGGSGLYTLYENLGHGTWNAAYSEPDFFSWMLEKDKANAHVYYLDSTLCATNSNGVDIGFTAGWPAYQWEKDGDVLISETTERLTITEPGVYRGRFSRVESSPSESDWNKWSEPILISESLPYKPVVNGHGSLHMPDINGSSTVTMTTPVQSNVRYRWFVNDVEQTGWEDTVRYVNTSVVGKYQVITETFAGCESLISDPIYVTTGSPSTITAPSNLQAVTTGSGSIQLFWTDNSPNETGFELVRSTSDTGPYDFVSLVPEDGIAYEDFNLVSGLTYYYRLRAVNDSEVSAYTPNTSISTGADTTPPTAPANLANNGFDISSVELTWSPSTDDTGISQYYIYFGSDSIATGSTDTTYTVTGLLPEFTFAFTVKAVDYAGNFSPPSNQISVATVFNGLDYTHSTGAWTFLNQIDWDFVEFEGHVDNFTLSPATQADFFNFRFTGYLYIDQAGDYDFRLRSDDGSRLLLNDDQVVNYDGTHGCGTRTRDNYPLAAGAHDLEVLFFERTGGQCLIVQYRGPDTGNSWVNIPDSALKSGDVDTANPPVAPSALTATSAGMSQIDLDWTFTGEHPEDLTVVVLGSSTAEGTGATAGNSWVELLDTWLGNNVTNHTLHNLARGGYTTEDIREDGSTPTPDSERNIDKALSFKPDVILINLPSNNVAEGIAPATTISHYNEIKAKADAAGVMLFLTTTQPRNFAQQSDRDLLTDEANLVRSNYGNYVLDIYDELTDFGNNKAIKVAYSSGDGIHLNDAGHAYIYGVVTAKLDEFLTTFEVFRSPDNSVFELIGETAETDFVSDNLTPNTTYYYRVRTKNLNGYSAYSNTDNATTSTDTQAPTVPTGVTITSNTYTNVGAYWTASTDNIGVDKYYIYIDGVLSDSTSSITYSTSSLSPSTNYTLTVSAVDISGNESAQSAGANFTTDSPQTFYSKAAGDLTLLSSWGTNTDGTGTAPPNFSYNGQYFVVSNRPSATVSSSWDIGGSISKVIIDDNTDLTLDNSVNGMIDVGSSSNIVINHDYEPEFGDIPTNSTVTFNTYSEVPLNTYGNLVLNGTGLKDIDPGEMTVMGDLTLGTGVGIKGAPGNASMIHVSGNVTQIGTGVVPSSDNAIGLDFMGTNSTFSMADDQAFYSISMPSSGTLNVTSASPVRLQIGSLNGGGLDIPAGATVDIDDNTLRIRNNGRLNASNTTGEIASTGGSLEIESGSSGHSYLRMSSTENDVERLLVNQTGAGNVIVQSGIEVFDGLTVENGTIDAANNLVIKSASGYNASIRQISGSGQITGNVNVERYLSARGEIYRYMSTPVANTSIADWQSYLPITGNFTGSSPQSGTPSMYYYDEVAGGWQVYPPDAGASSAELVQGRGYSIYMWDGTQAVTVENVGNPYQGNIAFTLAPGTGGGANDGWSLLGNPYASDIIWDNTNWTSTDIGDIAYIRVNESDGSHSYIAHDRTVGTGKIAAGQSFWVQSTSATPALTLTESAKSTDAATSPASHYRLDNTESTPPNRFSITLSNSANTERDEAYLKFTDDGSDLFVKGKDGVKLNNSNINISTLSSDGQTLVVNDMKNDFCSKEINISVQTIASGNYSIGFKDISSFGLGELVFIDTEEDIVTPITSEAFTYSFSVSTNNSTIADRFKVGVMRPEVVVPEVSLDIDQLCATDEYQSIGLNSSQIGVNYSIIDVVSGSTLLQLPGTGNELTLDIPMSSLKSGENEIQVYAEFSGCNPVVVGDQLTFDVAEEPGVFVENKKYSTCETSITLSAGGADNFNWYNAETDELLSASTSTFTPSQLEEFTTIAVRGVNELGCESSTTEFIQIISLAVNEPVIFEDQGILMTDSAKYLQWYYNGELIEGATNNYFAPENEGTYTVSASNGACSIESTGFDYLITGTELDPELDLSTHIYPNPAVSGKLKVRGVAKSNDALNIQIVDLQGKSLFSKTYDYSDYLQGIRIRKPLAPGLYIMKIVQGEHKVDHKFVIK